MTETKRNMETQNTNIRPCDLICPRIQGTCNICPKKVDKSIMTELEKKEHRISGMCALCQRSFFDPPADNKEAPLTEAEAEAWAAELDAEHGIVRDRPAASACGSTGGTSNDNMSEEYNRWHTLDDHLDYGALLRGIHNIQERGGSTADEERFLNGVCDRFGEKRFEFKD